MHVQLRGSSHERVDEVSRVSRTGCSPPSSFDPQARLQSKAGICAYLGHISPATYDSWQAKGLVPGPMPGTNRYDRRQHDHLLDQRAGIVKAANDRARSPYEVWSEDNAG